MNTKHKKTAVFGNCFTSRYRSTLPRAFNIVAEELNMDLYYFNFLGKIGNKNAQYGDYEIELLDYIDLTAFDGIIFDGEGYNVEGMADKVIRKLRSADCAVVSISSYVEGFYNIAFDDASGLRTLEHIFDENAINIGDYSAFFMMVHTDVNRCPAFDSDYLSPTGNYIPAIWIDKHQEYTGSPRRFDRSTLVPQANSDRSHFYYIMSVHCAERMFGYSVIEMAGKDIFNEFYNIWLLNLAITLENLLKNDRIRKLIEKLRNLSIRDGLTGLLNRRGFDDFSRNAIAAMCGTKTICTVVIDLDGLKHIKATPHKARLTAWRRICLHLFRHLAQKFLAGRQPSGVISIQSDEKSDCASAPPALCGIALTMNSVIMKVTARSRLSRISLCAAAIPMK